MKPGQNVYPEESLNEFENGLRRVKNYVNRSNFRKTLCTLWRPHFSLIIMKLGKNVCLDEISDEYENGSCWVEN